MCEIFFSEDHYFSESVELETIPTQKQTKSMPGRNEKFGITYWRFLKIITKLTRHLVVYYQNVLRINNILMSGLDFFALSEAWLNNSILNCWLMSSFSTK